MIPIQRIVLRRLLLAWVAVSILVGGVTYYVETEQTDEAIVDLAAREAEDFAPNVLSATSLSPEDLQKLQAKADEFVKRSFIVIEVYDAKERRILEAVNPQYENIEAELKQYKHTFPHNIPTYYEKYVVGGDTVVQVMVQLPAVAGKPGGFFEGVYIVDPARLEEYRVHLWHTLAAVLFAALATTVILYPVIISLNRSVVRYSQGLLKGNLEIASVLGAAIAKRDSDTGDHNYRVTLYAIRLAEAIGVPAAQMRNLILGAFLHDVGKIGISDNILLKPGRLTPEEFTIMRTHVELGVDIVEQSDWLQGAREVIESHHEKFDGAGYGRALKGEEIPLNARIFAVVDVFDALTSRRPYKEPMPLETALGIIRADSGTHFDPRIVEKFVAIAPAMHAGIGAAGEAELQDNLREMSMHYFLLASLEAERAENTA